ncbi:hypothetical protein V6N13_069051 [Hibiscus sabdariffa]|uniref:Uncharacterized protein n=1 Tax=Hibiscus sabdariffa TaxID=183260 RepID=A0ABR2QPE6_9ROSI
MVFVFFLARVEVSEFGCEYFCWVCRHFRARGVDDSVEWLKQWLKHKSIKAPVCGISRYVEGFMKVVFLGPLERFDADHGDSNGNKGGIETFIDAMWSNGLALDGMSRKSFVIA